MYSSARATQWGNSLFEFKVYGDTDPACSGPIKLQSLAAVSSANESSTLTPDKAIDGDLTTRWSSAFSNSQWIYVDLGTRRTINRVALNWEAAFGSKYDIQVSDNAQTWTTIYSNNAGDGGVDEITGLSSAGRYFRMNGRARGTAYGYSLFEFQIFGVP